MRVAALSNEKLDPWVNWSTLGPPLLRSLVAHSGGVHIAPPVISPKSVVEWGDVMRLLLRADTLFWMQGSARPETPIWAASMLRGLARRSAFVVDAWPASLNKIGWLAAIQQLDPCFVAFRQAKTELTKRFPKGRFEWMPFGVDANVFRPYKTEKDIFIYWMGRRYDPLHKAILAYCDARNLTYLYTAQGGQIRDPTELGKVVARSRYFVVTPPNLDNPKRTGDLVLS